MCVRPCERVASRCSGNMSHNWAATLRKEPPTGQRTYRAVHGLPLYSVSAETAEMQESIRALTERVLKLERRLAAATLVEDGPVLEGGTHPQARDTPVKETPHALNPVHGTPAGRVSTAPALPARGAGGTTMTPSTGTPMKGAVYTGLCVKVKGPCFSELGSMENLILFSQCKFLGWEGKSFAHCNDTTWRGTKSKLQSILAHFESLPTAASKKEFKEKFQGRGHFNFTRAYESIKG